MVGAQIPQNGIRYNQSGRNKPNDAFKGGGGSAVQDEYSHLDLTESESFRLMKFTQAAKRKRGTGGNPDPPRLSLSS